MVADIIFDSFHKLIVSYLTKSTSNSFTRWLLLLLKVSKAIIPVKFGGGRLYAISVARTVSDWYYRVIRTVDSNIEAVLYCFEFCPTEWQKYPRYVHASGYL